jgi:hypothetical protein
VNICSIRCFSMINQISHDKRNKELLICISYVSFLF